MHTLRIFNCSILRISYSLSKERISPIYVFLFANKMILIDIAILNTLVGILKIVIVL